MQREYIRRGFTIHQKVALEIDFGGSIRGYTDITILPTTGQLKTINLHCRQCDIEAVTVASYKADFLHHDPLSALTVSNPKDCHAYPEYKRKLFSALMECEEGELSIAIPGQVSLKQADVTTARIAEEPTSSGHAASIPAADFAPVVIHIEYGLRRPVDGLQFCLPTDANPYRVPHVFTTPSSPDAARCWVPCLDAAWEKCTWDFEFVVPKYLEERDQDKARARANGDYEPEDTIAEDHYPTVVVCSGDLVEQVAHPFSSTKTIFLFSLSAFTSVQHVAFAAGPFHIMSLTPESTSDASETTTSQPPIHAFCLPGAELALSVSTSFLRNAMTFYTDFGQYPYSSYKLIFVDELVTQHFDGATMSIVSTDLLHERDAIDQVYETRSLLAHALACQWAGVYIQPKTFSDTWLVNGISLYITGLYLKKHLGVNEYRFRMRKDMDRVVNRDVGTMPPVCQPQILEPPDPATLSFINLKAPLILHVLDRKLGKSGTSLGLSRALPKIFLSAISGDMPANALSTHSFLRTCRKVSGVDLRSFADQWIYGSGCPRFGFQATFNRKRMAVELTMRQEVPAYIHNERDPVALSLLKPVPFFDGQMTIRIHEADGTPYEHVLDLRTPFKKYEVPFNTKYKRVRRNTKRFLARQAAAAAAAQGDVEAAEAIGMIDMGFGLEVWEDVKERENWKVADWSEEDETVMSGAVYEWIRLDADFEWISLISFEQPDYMWVSQLQRDRDVVAQLEAVTALANQPSLIVSSMLTKTALVANYFFRVRVEAVLALVSCAIRKLDFIGLFHLFKMFLRYCYRPENATQELFMHKYVPRPNDFSDIADYFVRKSIVTAVSLVRLENGKSPPVVRQFLVDQLRYNDNTNNPFADAIYICNVISALATATVPNNPPERGELTSGQPRTESSVEDSELLASAVAEVERYRNMDRLVPSSHNVVTIAALEFRLILSLANLIVNDCKPFLACSREGNYTQVRMIAFDGLLLSKWFAPKVMNYLFSVMMHDSSALIRRHLARSMCESLAVLFSVGEIKSLTKDGDSLLIEEDSALPERSAEARKSDPDVMLKSLRKDKEIGRNDVLRDVFMPLLLSKSIDYEVRWTALKLAEMTLRGADEPQPKVVIHLPPTPVSEQPPLLPIVLNKGKATVRGQVPPINTKADSTSSPSIAKIRLPSAKPIVSATPIVASRSKKQALAVKGASESKKKTKPGPKGQSGGMSSNDLRACRNALKKLLNYKHSVLFQIPVDPIRDKAPRYFDVIKTPMDLSTMGAKLEAGMYNDRFALERDFRLMINNAKEYNATGTFAYNEALALDGFFVKQWARIHKTLERAEQATRQHSDFADMDVDTAIASVLDLGDSQIPAKTSSTPKVAPAPKLKLKVGGNTQSSTPPVARSGSTKPKKVKVPQVKQVSSIQEMREEGSPDDFLLQEVIALEQDHPSRASSTRPLDQPANQSPSKSRTDTSNAVIKIRRPATLSIEPSAEKQGPPPLKGKQSVPKSRTATPKTSTPAPSSHPFNDKKARDVLKTLRKMPEAAIFNKPVDPELDGCPTYYDEIKYPMDFQTISSKIDRGDYHTSEEFASDVQLVFSNCRKFNPPTTAPVQLADFLEKTWKKEWSKANEKKLGGLEKRGLQGLMNRLMKEEYLVFFFREPVDPVALGIPDYFDIIPKKDARDLRTIRSKLDSDKYISVDAFEADIKLMVDNAIKFNGMASEVAVRAQGLLAQVEKMLEPIRTSPSKKRKDDHDFSTPVKKQKV